MGEIKNIKVLIVDDEKVVRDFLVRFLSLCSVEPIAVENGLQAIEAVKKDSIDLVFMDIRMPGMDGLETLAEIKKINPNIKCAFMTGYAIEAESLLTKNPGTICLKKPFEDLKKIQEVIDKFKEENFIAAVADKHSDERRAYFRFDIVLEVDYRIKTEALQDKYNHCLTKDITPGGIRLFILESLNTGTILELVVKFPEYNETLSAAVEVIWSRKSEEKPGYYDTGIKFLEIDVTRFAGFLINCSRPAELKHK